MPEFRESSESTLTPRVTGIAGLAFVVIGVIELALTQGAIPSPTAAPEEMTAYLEGAEGTGPVVALLSGAAAISLLVFGAGLRRRMADADTTLANLSLTAAGVTVTLALAGQAVHQTALIELSRSDSPSGLSAQSSLVGFLFLFAVLGGGAMAGSAGLAGLRSGFSPRWLAALGVLVLAIELVLVGVPELSGAAFPVFIVWLVVFSIWMIRAGKTTGKPTVQSGT